MKLDTVLVFFALIFGVFLGHYVMNSAHPLETKIVTLLLVLGFSFVLSQCNSLLEELDEIRWQREIKRLFGNLEDEND